MIKNDEIQWKRDLVPQVIEHNLDDIDIPDQYIGFIYLWTNLKNQKWYLGKHQGYPRDGYLFSSEDEDFLSDFTAEDSQFRYEIVCFVDTNNNDLTNMERTMLLAKDARQNPLSYNKSNGIPVHVDEPDWKKVMVLADRIIDQEFPIVDRVSVKSLFDKQGRGERIQSRLKDDNQRIKEITGHINDEGGRTHKCNPVVIAKGYVWKKDTEYSKVDPILDGNQTIQATMKSQKGTHLRVQEVPAVEFEDFTEQEMVLLCNALNPNQEVSKKAACLDDFEKFIERGYIQDGYPVKSENNKVIGKKVWKLHGGTVRAAMDRVLNKIVEEGNSNDSKENYIDYSTPLYKPRLEKKKSMFNSLGGVRCITFKSSYFKLNMVISELSDMVELNRSDEFELNELRILMWHGLPSQRSDWFDKWEKQHKTEFKNVTDGCGIKTSFYYMDEWDSGEGN